MKNALFFPHHQRGLTQTNWLTSYHSFSFGGFYDPKRMGFGLLRVLNDDTVAPSGGFDTHSHSDMEIVAIPLRGALKHRDSLGNEHIIREGDIQIMSAGTGISHSEFNASTSERVDFLQIWIKPESKGLKPSYDQKSFAPESFKNRWNIIASPQTGEGVKIHQNSYFLLGDFEAGSQTKYQLRSPAQTGLFVFVIEGLIVVDELKLGRRDAAAFTENPDFSIEVNQQSRVLLIEVPLS